MDGISPDRSISRSPSGDNKLVVQSDMARSIAGEMQNVSIVSCDFYEKDNILY